MAAPTLDNTAGNAGAGAASSATFNLATSTTNVVIVACIYIENNGGAVPTVSSITGGSLTFANRRVIAGPTGGSCEVWWALAPTSLGSTAFTVNLSGSTDALVISAFGVKGCNTAAPWDANASLATANGSHNNTSWTPSVTGVSTTNANDFLLMFVGADANFAGSTTVPSGFTSIDKNAQGHFEFCDIATSYQGVTSAQSGATFTWGAGLTPDHSGVVIFDALTADPPPPAITVRATTTGPSNHSTTTTINLPTGTTTGDITIVIGSYLPQTAVTIPGGWTTILNELGQFACYRMWQSGDPSSVTFTGATTDWWETLAISYIGVDSTTPIDTSNSCFSQSQHWGNSIYIAPSVCPSWNNDLLLACFWGNSFSGGGTFTPPSGFTSRVSTNSGPNLAISDKQLSSAAVTGNAVATFANFNLTTLVGAQIALHAAGDTSATPAAAPVTWGSVYANSGLFSGSSFTIPLTSALNPMQNDLICIFLADNDLGGSYPSTPTGFTLQASGGGSFLFTRSYQTGDPDPQVPLTATNYSTHAVVALRSVGNTPSVDQVNSAAGSGSPHSTATLASMTPAGASEYLMAWFGQMDTSGGDTWTPPAGFVQQLTCTNGPSAMLCDMQPASVPTGTIAGTDSLSTAIEGIGLLVIPGGGGGGGGGGSGVVVFGMFFV